MKNPLYIAHILKDREIKSSLDDRWNVIIYIENETQYHRLINIIILYYKYTYLQLPRNNNEYEWIYCFDRCFNFLWKYTIGHLISWKESNDICKRLVNKFLKDDERFISRCIVCWETGVPLTDVQWDSLCDNCHKEYLKAIYKPRYIHTLNKIKSRYKNENDVFNDCTQSEKIKITFMLCVFEILFIIVTLWILNKI